MIWLLSYYISDVLTNQLHCSLVHLYRIFTQHLLFMFHFQYLKDMITIEIQYRDKTIFAQFGFIAEWLRLWTGNPINSSSKLVTPIFYYFVWIFRITFNKCLGYFSETFKGLCSLIFPTKYKIASKASSNSVLVAEASLGEIIINPANELPW